MDTGVTVLHSERLGLNGFVHGFSTRVGGVSVGAYSSLNLGRAVGDDLDHVHENTQRFARAVGVDPAKIFEASQVHGADVLTVAGDEDPSSFRAQKADALVCRARACAIGVRTADCVPVLLGARRSRHVAAVHAGWRGVVSGVVPAAIHALTEHPDEIVAAIGPSIGPCCFEVGDDVAQQLASVAGDGIVLRDGLTKPHVDLWRAVEHQLHAAGVSVIDTLGRCTVCEPEQFFSFRRDGQHSGRMLSVIGA